MATPRLVENTIGRADDPVNQAGKRLNNLGR
jgi:hypothetical protein